MIHPATDHYLMDAVPPPKPIREGLVRINGKYKPPFGGFFVFMKDEIVNLAKELIRIPSVSEDITHSVAVLEVVKKQLPESPFTPFVSEGIPSLLYRNTQAEQKNFKIIFNAHLDVIPGTKDQYHPYEKDGKLYGRGAFDTKAAAAAMILLFKKYAHSLSYPLGLQLSTDEESNGKYGTGYQVKQGIRGDFVICAECNSNLRITNQSKGRRIIKIAIKGHAAHSAYSWNGKNAILEMYKALAPIIEAYPIPENETNATTVSITKIETTNEAINMIPDHCSAYIDVRFEKKDEETIIPRILSLLPKDATVEVTPLHPAHAVAADHPYILTLQSLVKEIHGKDLPVRLAHGTSDATYYPHAVEFGPIGHGAHHEDEWVDIQSLEEYYRILERFLLDLNKEN